jgi:hypothetical protein
MSQMSMSERHMEEVEERGWDDIGTTLCSACVSDIALIRTIEATGGLERCDYCGEHPHSPSASAPIEIVLALVVYGLRFEYEDPIEQMAWDEGEYVGGAIYNTSDLLWELEVSEHQHVVDALVDAIVTTQWCQRDPYAATPSEALAWGGRHFAGT